MFATVALAATFSFLSGLNDWRVHRAVAAGPAVPARIVAAGSCDGWWHCGLYEEAWRVRFRTIEGESRLGNVVAHRGDYELGYWLPVRYDPGNPAHVEDVRHGSRAFGSIAIGATLLVGLAVVGARALQRV